MRDIAAPSTNLRVAIIAVLALAAAPAIGLGIARFAYALVLPDMKRAFGWSYSEAGLPNALNAVGYLAGAMSAGWLAARIGAFRLVVASAFVAVLATAASAFALGLWTLSALRFVSGMAAAHGVVAGGAVAIGLGMRAGPRSSLVVALFYVGPPFGIILSTLAMPLATFATGVESWRAVWAALGILSLALLAALASPALRAARPAETGVATRAPLAPMAWLLAAYAAFGAGYIAYMTFMIAFLREGGASLAAQSAFWCAIGVAGLASPFLWAGPLGRLAGGRAFALTTLVTLAGAAAPLLSRSFSAELISGAVFGSSFFAVVAATTLFVRRTFPPEAWASGIGAMTVAFSAGQAIGPLVTGLATDLFGGLNVGLGCGAALLALAVLLACQQRPVTAGSRPP